MDYMSGGDLDYNLQKRGKNCFNEKEVRFFVACMILGIEEMHKNKLMHKDLKP